MRIVARSIPEMAAKLGALVLAGQLTSAQAEGILATHAKEAAAYEVWKRTGVAPGFSYRGEASPLEVARLRGGSVLGPTTGEPPA